MRDPSREVVVTGVGICSHMGDALDEIEADLRQGRATPFPTWQPAVEHEARCQLLGLYTKELSFTSLGIDKGLARFLAYFVAALLGLLQKVRDMGLPLVSVASVEVDNNP